VSNMHRIQWFDQQIREGKNPNSNHLAQQFEISKRQAQRDIEYLGVSLRAPLLYISKNRGYCYEDQTFVLPLLYMTEEEKKVLKFLAFRYKQYNYENAAAVNRVGHLLSRFTDQQEVEGASNRIPIFDADPRLMQNIQLLSHAIQECLVVHITYNHLEEEAKLRIYPLKLVTHYNDDYVVAFCKQQNKKRTFRLEGIKQATVTDERFERTIINTDEWENSSSPVRIPFTAKVLLSRSLNGGTWNGYAVRSVDKFIYEIEFYDVDSFLQHLLTSEWLQLLSPKWLRTKLQGRCQNVLAQLNFDE
jgi:predicted DNA-binding transcriptional regulator YafY